MSHQFATGQCVAVRAATLEAQSAILWALAFIQAHLPSEAAHIARVAREIRHDPSPCPSAWGCVAPHSPWVIHIAPDPARVELVELVLTILHEAKHADVDSLGRWYIRDAHDCQGVRCSDPAVRAVDPVYAYEDRMRPVVVASIRAMGLDPLMSAPVHASIPTASPGLAPPAKSSSWGFFAVVGALALVAGGVVYATQD